MEQTPQPTLATPHPPVRIVRVLVVEAEESQAALATALLQHTQHSPVDGVQFVVEWAGSCAGALARTAAGAYDALVLDYELGDGDAVALLERLRAAGVTTPALVVTPGPPGELEGVAARVVGAGADYHLPKPEGLIGDALGRAVLAMLERRRLAAAVAEAQALAAQAEEVLLAAQAVGQHLTTTLAATAGTNEQLAASPKLPDQLRPLARAAADSTAAAAETLSSFQQVAQLEADLAAARPREERGEREEPC